MDLFTKFGIIPSSGGVASQTLEEILAGKGCMLYYDALKADGSGLPINSPLTSPWVDLINAYDGTLYNFAGTTSSGWDTTNSATPFLKGDGSNDYVDTGLAAANLPITSGVGSFWVYAKVKIGALGSIRSISSMDRTATGGVSLFDLAKGADNKLYFSVYAENLFSHTVVTAINAHALDDVVRVFGVCDMTQSTRKLQLYVESTPQASSGNTFTGLIATPTGNLQLGCRMYADAKTNYWNGGIYRFAFGSSALTDADVVGLIAAGI